MAVHSPIFCERYGRRPMALLCRVCHKTNLRSALQSPKEVAAYFLSEQLLPFGCVNLHRSLFRRGGKQQQLLTRLVSRCCLLAVQTSTDHCAAASSQTAVTVIRQVNSYRCLALRGSLLIRLLFAQRAAQFIHAFVSAPANVIMAQNP